MNTPLTDAPDWVAEQASPWLTENEAKRMIEALARYGVIEDRDLSAPPGSCADGACYLIADSATGLWASHDGEMAVAVGANAASGWYFVPVAAEGVMLFIKDEDIAIRYNGAEWASAPSASQIGYVPSDPGNYASNVNQALDELYVLAASGGGGGGGGGGVSSQRVTALGWRLRAITEAPNSGEDLAIGEIEFNDSGGSNMASGGTAVSSSIFSGGYPAADAFDGVTTGDNGWASADARSVGEWCGYIFANPVAVYSVDIYPYGDDVSQTSDSYALEYTEDGEIWFPHVLWSAPAAWSDGVAQTITVPEIVPMDGGSSSSAGGTLTLIEMQSVTAEGQIDLEALNGGDYAEIIILANLKTSDDGSNIGMQFMLNGTYKTSDYNFVTNQRSTSAASNSQDALAQSNIALSGIGGTWGIGNNTLENVSFRASIIAPMEAVNPIALTYQGVQGAPSGQRVYNDGGGDYTGVDYASELQGIRLLVNAGTLTGQVYVFGVLAS